MVSLGTGDRMDTKDKLYKVLRNSIELHDRTPTLRELQARTGRDVQSLREALKELHADGLVEWRPGGGIETIRLTKRRPQGLEPPRDLDDDGAGMRYFTEH